MRGAAPAAGRSSTRRSTGPTESASWSESAMLLYEEAVQRQWSSATDIPWAEMPELSEDLELAMSQLCTFLTQVEFIAGDVPGKYAPNVSGEYFEIGLFLASPDHGRGAAPRRLPQARARERHRPAEGGAGRHRAAHGAGLHRDGIDAAPRRRRLRAVDVPHGRDVRADAKSTSACSASPRRTRAATSRSASCT